MTASYWAIRAATTEDFSTTFTFLNSDGTPTNVATWVSSMQVYDDASGTLLIDVGVSGTFVNGGAAGTITAQVPETLMKTLTPGLYRYDYRGAPTGGQVRRLAGPFLLEAGTTLP